MKMSPGLFWGIVLIVIGISIIFRVVFDVNIVRVSIGILLIFFGIKVLVGKKMFNSSEGKDVYFSERKITEVADGNNEYNVICGKAVYDLRDFKLTDTSKAKIELNAICGGAVLIINPELPVKIKAEAVFGNVVLPNNNSTSFGSLDYTSGNKNDNGSVLNIKASAVFGNIDIKHK